MYKHYFWHCSCVLFVLLVMFFLFFNLTGVCLSSAEGCVWEDGAPAEGDGESRRECGVRSLQPWPLWTWAQRPAALPGQWDSGHPHCPQIKYVSVGIHVLINHKEKDESCHNFYFYSILIFLPNKYCLWSYKLDGQNEIVILKPYAKYNYKFF